MYALLLCTSSGFHKQAIKRRNDSLKMALELRTIQVPVQSDVQRYYSIVTETVKEPELLRWYIASIANATATIEMVVWSG